MKRLKHDNILKYIDCIEDNEQLYIILEYMENGSLAQIIKKCGPFPETLVVYYIK